MLILLHPQHKIASEVLVSNKSATKKPTVATSGCDAMHVGGNTFCTEFGSQNLIYEALLGLTLDEDVQADQ
jgi:hypothetical protein